MSWKDKEKMAFHIDEGVFCYTKMPFGLKNVGATYQRLVDTKFEGPLGRNPEAYVDDIVIKSKMKQDLIQDVKETLLTLKKVNMKLNPKRCSFRMEEDRLKKCTNKKDFRWTEATDKAFQAMKSLIVELPTLTAYMKYEELMVYLSAANKTVSAVLLVERKGRQMLIHYVSRSLQGTEVKKEQTDLDPATEVEVWKLYTDGACNDHGSRAGLILIDPEDMEYSYELWLNFSNSNNDAEYEALFAGLMLIPLQ
ncbi:reverse transcriptase domain-containing protein [Tanacetum coccineum]